MIVQLRLEGPKSQVVGESALQAGRRVSASEAVGRGPVGFESPLLSWR